MIMEPKLKTWIKTWAGVEAIFLTPEGWYTIGHDIQSWSKSKDGFWYPEIISGTYIWSPPPAAADACIEELRKARMKRKKSTHIVIVQRLMTPKWLKQLNKAADCIFSICATYSFWPAYHCEPLIVAIIFPYLNHRPYQVKGTPKMFQMGRSLSQVFQNAEMDGGSDLSKFLLAFKRINTMPECMV